MSVRYIGAILIFLGCGAFGFAFAANCRREERCLSELVRLLEYMSSELEYRLTPLPQICANAAENASGWLKTVFSALTKELENQIAPDAGACMEAAMLTARDIPQKVKNLLQTLGNSLGKFDLQGQMNEFSVVKEQCQAQLAQMRDKIDVRLRSYQTMGLCIGAGLAILFL